MRLWSLHPKYLDTKGLGGCWNEALLAQKVLLGKTKGYKNHSQLIRFKKCEFPKLAIVKYLEEVYKESVKRKFNYNEDLIDKDSKLLGNKIKLTVTKGQLKYEFEHLQDKLWERDTDKYWNNYNSITKKKQLRNFNNEQLIIGEKMTKVKPHPLFKIIEGDIEDWEVLK
jgi:hypothetical protein